LWENKDEDVIAQFNNGPDSEKQPRKRKKAYHKKEPQSIEVVAGIFGSGGDTPKPNRGQVQVSQFTPPNPGKRTKSRFGVTPKRNAEINVLFQDAAVTKVSSFREKEWPWSVNTSPSVSQYQRFTTTEDSLKASRHCVNRTTMEKLNTFRFRPLSKQQQETTIQSSSQQPTTESVRVIPSKQEKQPHSDLRASDYEPLPSNYISKKARANSNATYEYLSTLVVHRDLPDRRLSMYENKHTNFPTGLLSQSQSEPPRSLIEPTEPAHDEYGFEGPNSCDGTLLNESLKGLDAAKGVTVEPPQITSTEASDERIGKTNLQIYYSNENDFGHGAGPSNVKVDNTHSVKQPAAKAEQEATNAYVISEFSIASGRSTTEVGPRDPVEVDCSIFEEELLLYIEQGFNDIDEYDDGVDDVDLLAIVNHTAVLETPLKSRVNSSNATHLVTSKPGRVPSNSERGAVALHMTSTKPVKPLSVQVHQSYTLETEEEEFPMDEGEENELLNLADPLSEVKESFIPPVSVQNPYDHDMEVYDSSLQFSPPNSGIKSARQSPSKYPGIDHMLDGAEEDWCFIGTNRGIGMAQQPQIVSSLSASLRQPVQRGEIAEIHSPTPARPAKCGASMIHVSDTQAIAVRPWLVIDDSHEYEPLKPFVRPPFPPLITDRCPVLGLSARTFLRTCFRIGEMFQQGTKCNTLGLDAVIELFARVNSSSREPGTTKQHFQFLDLFTERGPNPNATLANYKATGLAESESKVFLCQEEKKLARVLGRLKRDKKYQTWWLEVINIRETDWEEIKWTKRIVSGDGLGEKVKDLILFE
jgi:hypothetical protein